MTLRGTPRIAVPGEEQQGINGPARGPAGAAVLLAYLFITLALTYPWILHFSTHTPDAGGEGSLGLWNLWHFRHGLVQGSPFTTDLLAPPFEIKLAFHTYTISRDLLALPLLPVFGLVTTSNLLLLGSFVLSGWGAYLLVRELTGDPLASFAGGLVYAFTPYRFAHLTGHYQLVTMEWIPFYALFALRFLRSGGPRGSWRPLGSPRVGPLGSGRGDLTASTWQNTPDFDREEPLGSARWRPLGSLRGEPLGSRRGEPSASTRQKTPGSDREEPLGSARWGPLGSLRVGPLGSAALFALLTSLTDYYYSLFLAAWTGAVVLLRLATDRDRAQALRRSLALGGTVLLVHLPLLGLMGRAYSQGAWVGRPAGLAALDTFSADLAAFATPSAQHPLFGSWASTIGASFRAGFAEGTVYLGLVPLALAGVATLRFRRLPAEGRMWVFVFWGFLLLSLGPALHWLGEPLFPLPARWLAEVPVLREVRVPSRWVVMAVLALAALTGSTLAWIRSRTLKVSKTLGILLAAGLILFEYLPAPLHLADRSVPAVYAAIAADPVPGAVLDLPFGLNDSFRGLGGWNPRALYFQTVTERPIVGAHVSRIPAEVFDAYAEMPILGTLARIERGEAFTETDVLAGRERRAEVAALLDLRYIVVPEGYMGSAAVGYLLAVFEGCLEAMPGDARAAGYLVGPPCR